MAYIRVMGIHKLVLEGLMDDPHPEVRKEIDRRTSEAAGEPGDSRYLAGKILFWIAMDIDDYNRADQFTADGRDLIRAYCEASGVDEEVYAELLVDNFY
jgi:hypothetical protein